MTLVLLRLWVSFWFLMLLTYVISCIIFKYLNHLCCIPLTVLNNTHLQLLRCYFCVCTFVYNNIVIQLTLFFIYIYNIYIYILLSTRVIPMCYYFYVCFHIPCVPLSTEPGISLIILPLMSWLTGGPLLRVATIRRTTDTFLFISPTTNVPLFKFRCNIFIGVRIIKEILTSVASRAHCLISSFKIMLNFVLLTAQVNSNLPVF